MRVGVDARTVFSPARRGTGKNLIDLYSALADRRPDWTFVMFHQNDRVASPFTAPNIQSCHIDIRGDRWNLWQDVRLPVAAVRERVDVLHCPANSAPYYAWTPTVVTVHDLIPLEHTPAARTTRRWEHRVRRSAQRAHCVLTPSRYSRSMIVSRLRVAEEKVVVNYWAPDRTCRRVTDPSALRAMRLRYHIPQDAPYILVFGAEDPRKNTLAVVEAWGRVRRRLTTNAVLLIVGVQPCARARFAAAVRGSGLCDRDCLLQGFADETDIAALLSGATALCYPSRSEGFGLPVVDAFACRTPVITSRVTSLPEIAGDAALLVDPSDPESIADALVRVLTSEVLREWLRAAGAARVTAFSWERCAGTAADVLEVAARREIVCDADRLARA